MPAQKWSLQETGHATNADEQLQQQQQPEEEGEEQRLDSFQQSHAKLSQHERQQLELQQDERQLEHQRQLEDEDQKEDEEMEAEGGEEEEDEDEDEEEEEEEEGEGEGDEEGDEDDSEGTSSSPTSGDKPKFVFVALSAIRKDVQCPICLGIIKKTRTVMECLHRFCRKCIDKSMRLGNNECPACRTHCASRRSLRDDPNYDALIAALYPDIDKYEEEELAFHAEERDRNKQIQASIAQIFQRQSEALVKRRTLGKDSASPLMTRSQRHPRSAHLRRKRNSRGTEHQGSEDNEDGNDENGAKDSSSNDERAAEVRPRGRKRRLGVRSSQPSSSAPNSDGGCFENDIEGGRESRGLSPGLVWNPEKLAWGRGGTRSNTRHGNASGCNSKSSRSARLSKLVEYLRSLQENNDELDVHLMLVSVDTQSAPSLQQPYLCCRSSLSVKQLSEYISLQTPLQAEEVELFMVKERLDTKGNQSTPIPTTDQLQLLEGQETLAAVKVNHTSSRDHMILAYRRKHSV